MDRRGNSSMDRQDCSAFRCDPSPSSPAFIKQPTSSRSSSGNSLLSSSTQGTIDSTREVNHLLPRTSKFSAPAQRHPRGRLFGESERRSEDWQFVSSPVARPISCRTPAFRQQQSSSRSSSGNSHMKSVSDLNQNRGFEQQPTSSRSSSGNSLLSSSTQGTIDSTREVNHLLPRTPRSFNRKTLSARAPRRNVKDIVIDSNYKSPTRRSAPFTRRAALSARRSAALKPIKIDGPKGSLRHDFGRPITPPPKTPQGQSFFGNDFVVPQPGQNWDEYIQKLKLALTLAREKQAEARIKKTEPDFQVYADSESDNERSVEIGDSDDDWGGAGITGVRGRPASNQNRVPGSPGIGSGLLPKGISARWQERNPNFLPEKFRIKKQPGSIFSRPQAKQPGSIYSRQHRSRPVIQDENITPLPNIFRTGIATREDDDVPRKPGLYLRPGGKGIKLRQGLMESSQRDANRDNILANRQPPSLDDRRSSTRQSYGLPPRSFGY